MPVLGREKNLKVPHAFHSVYLTAEVKNCLGFALLMPVRAYPFPAECKWALCAPSDLPATLLVAKSNTQSNFFLLQMRSKLAAMSRVQPVPLTPTLPMLALKHTFHWVWHHSVFKDGQTRTIPIFTQGQHTHLSSLSCKPKNLCSPPRICFYTSISKVSMQKFLIPSFYFVLELAQWFHCAKGCLVLSFVFMGIGHFAV